MNKIPFQGVTFYVHEENIYNVGQVFIKVGVHQITTKETKKHIDNIIDIISYTVDAGAIFDERLEKYSKALDVLNAIRAIFSGKVPRITAEAAKITIEVVKEVALLDEANHAYRMGINSAAFAAKLFIDAVSKDE